MKLPCTWAENRTVCLKEQPTSEVGGQLLGDRRAPAFNSALLLYVAC